MSKWIFKYTTLVMLDLPHINGFAGDKDFGPLTPQEQIENSLDIGSKCWVSEIIDQLAGDLEKANEKGFCVHHEEEVELVRQATDEDIERFTIND